LAHVTDTSLFSGKSVNSVVIYKSEEEPIVYVGAVEIEELVKWSRSEGYPLIDELAQKIWQRSSTSGVPLLAVFVNVADEAELGLVKDIARKFKGQILTSYSTVPSLATRWGTSGKKFPTAVLVHWKGQEPKMTVFDEDAETFTVETGESFITKTLAGEYHSYRKSEPIPDTNDAPVKVLVGKNFDEIVLDKEKDVFVEFYSPSCGHCKKLAPVWDELGESFDGTKTVTIAKIDATANTLPENLEIKGFPTLIMFPADKKEGVPYSGDRDLDSLRKFVIQHAAHSIKEDL